VLCGAVIAPLAVASTAVASAADAGTAAATAKVALRGELAEIPAGVTRLGAAPGSEMLHIDVGLAGRDPAALDAEVAAVSTPGSASYHHYLSAAQFAAAYGPSPTEVQLVTAALRAEGLTVGAPTLGSSLLPVSASVRAISAAFGTSIESVRLPSHLTSTVNTSAPEIPAVLAPDITGVIGLSALSQEHSMLRRRATATSGAASGAASAAAASAAAPDAHAVAAQTGGPQACVGATDAAGSGGYTSTQLASDYGLSQLFAQGRTAVGQTIGIVEFERFSTTDIATFQACYGLSNPVRVVTVDGSPGGSPEGSGEAALDIELASVSAPSSSLIVYESPNTAGASSIDMLNRIASDDQAQVVTTSWGECEQDNAPGDASQEQPIFARMAVQGQTMVAASGDAGSEDCYDPFSNSGETQLAVDDPGSQPDVLSVGGTSMIGGNAANQSAWNNCGVQLGVCQEETGNGAGGGGFSVVWPRPAWQPPTVAGRSAPNQRMVPDLSLNADLAHGLAFYFSGWGQVGGTSVVAPQISGFLADTDQGCSSPVGLAGPGLYAAANSATFSDVTTGNNDFTGTNSGDYAAGTGYDLATGLGTPEEQNLAIALQGVDGCPSVAALSSNGGAISGAGPITVSGGGLADASAITFGAAGPGRIVSQTETSAVVVPPSPGHAFCVQVTVTNPEGVSVATAAGSFAFGGAGDCNGYRFVASDGGVFDFGSATFAGSTGGMALAAPIVGMATTPDGGGYWLVASDGGIFTFGDAHFYGSTGAVRLNRPIVGMAATPDGGGYWLVASDGGIFTFGDATYYGSTGGIRLNEPIVGMAPTAGGGGYWLVASDGGIFTFGDAPFDGSMGGTHLNEPIVGMAATPDGGGYWLVASDGGIFTFGDAPFEGSTGGIALNRSIVGMAPV